MIRRGVTLSVAASATLLADTILAAAVPPLLAVATVHAAARFAAGTTLSACGISASVAVLTEGGLKMVASKTMTLILTLTLAFGVIGSGVGILAQRTEPAAAVAAHPKGVPPLAPVIERAPNAAEGAKENMLAVTIKPQKSRIRASEPFKVDLRVVNSSKSLQSFRAMIGSWHRHWFTSNERVLVSAWPGSEDEAIEVTLAPGEADEKTLPMIILAGKSLDKESFKLGFTPIGSKQTFWSNEVTVEVDQDKKGPRFVPVASYPSEDRAAEKRIRELLDAAKITFISVGSRGLTASVGEDKAKQARAILEKAVVAGTLTVQVLDALPMPKNLRAVRTDDKLRIEEDIASNEEVIVPVAGGLIRATDCELSIYRGKERVSHTGGTYTPPFDRTRAASKIPNPGESYEVELVVWWFETDAPHQPNWKPQSGGKYKVLVTRTLKLNVGPENSKSAVPPPNRWEKLLQNRELTAKQRAAYEQIANLHTVKLDQEDHRGAISVPSFVKNSKLPTDVLYAMGLDALPMLAEALDDETPTATVITARGGDVMLVKVWKVNEFAALLIVRIAGRDFVIGEFPKALDIRDIAQNPKEAPRFRKLVVAWHSKFATKTPTERTLADLTDPWFRNRFDAIIALGNGKVKEARAPIAARVDAYFADPNREVSSTTQWEMTYSALALGQIGDRASLPQVRRVCADMSHTMYMSYRPLDQGRWGRGSSLNENLFRAYDALTLLGQKDEAVTELTRLLATYGAEMEASTRKDYEERLNAAKGEAPKK